MKVWNVRKGKPRPPAGHRVVYCGRPGPYRNPFEIGKDGTRAEVIEKFRDYAVKKLRRDPEWLKPLEGADGLSCWCAPEPCHCDIIIELLQGVRQMPLPVVP